jgi:hypothetical protein
LQKWASIWPALWQVLPSLSIQRQALQNETWMKFTQPALVITSISFAWFLEAVLDYLISHDLYNKYSLECVMPEWMQVFQRKGGFDLFFQQGDQKLVYHAHALQSDFRLVGS